MHFVLYIKVKKAALSVYIKLTLPPPDVTKRPTLTTAPHFLITRLKSQSVFSSSLNSNVLAHPGGGPAVVVDEERPSVWSYSHLPSWGQEALLGLVLRLWGAVRGRLGRLRVRKCVFHSPPYLNVVGSLGGGGSDMK